MPNYEVFLARGIAKGFSFLRLIYLYIFVSEPAFRDELFFVVTLIELSGGLLTSFVQFHVQRCKILGFGKLFKYVALLCTLCFVVLSINILVLHEFITIAKTIGLYTGVVFLCGILANLDVLIKYDALKRKNIHLYACLEVLPPLLNIIYLVLTEISVYNVVLGFAVGLGASVIGGSFCLYLEDRKLEGHSRADKEKVFSKTLSDILSYLPNIIAANSVRLIERPLLLSFPDGTFSKYTFIGSVTNSIFYVFDMFSLALIEDLRKNLQENIVKYSYLSAVFGITLLVLLGIFIDIFIREDVLIIICFFIVLVMQIPDSYLRGVLAAEKKNHFNNVVSLASVILLYMLINLIEPHSLFIFQSIQIICVAFSLLTKMVIYDVWISSNN